MHKARVSKCFLSHLSGQGTTQQQKLQEPWRGLSGASMSKKSWSFSNYDSLKYVLLNGNLKSGNKVYFFNYKTDQVSYKSDLRGVLTYI